MSTDVLTSEDPSASYRARLLAASVVSALLVWYFFQAKDSKITGFALAAAPWVFLALYVASIIAAVLSFLNSWFPDRLLYSPWGAYRIPISRARGLNAKRIALVGAITSRLEDFGVRDALRVSYEVTSRVMNFVFLPLAWILPGGWVAKKGVQEEKVVRVVSSDGTTIDFVSPYGLPKRYQNAAKPRSEKSALRAERMAKAPLARPHDIKAVEHRFGVGAQVVDFTFAIGSVLCSYAWLVLR